MTSNQQYTMYGGDISWYSGKARAYLRFKDVPFQELPADREAYKKVILPRVGWPVIPVVITPEDEVLQDWHRGSQSHSPPAPTRSHSPEPSLRPGETGK